MPAIARIGDATTCGVILTGSSTTFADGIGMARATVDTDSCPCIPAGPAAIVTGSPTVFVDGSPVARVGDSDGCPANISAGSPTTFAN